MSWTEKYVNADATGLGDGSSEANGWATVAAAITAVGVGPAATPTRINVKRPSGGAYAQGVTGLTFNTAGTTANPLWWRGYNTTPGDCDADETLARPSITWGDAGMTASAAHQRWSSINFTGAKSTGALLNISAGAPQTYDRCRVENTLASTSAARAVVMGTSGVTITRCQLKAAAGASYVVSGGGVIAGCDIEGGALGIDSTVSIMVTDTVIHGCASHGVNVGTTGQNIFLHNTFYSCGGDGIRWAAAVPGTTSIVLVASNIFSAITGTALNNATGTNTAVIHRQSNLFHSVGAQEAGFGDSPAIGAQADSVSPFTNAAAGDFTLVSSSGGKGKAFPQGQYEGHSFRSYGDVGALQRQETAGGGTYAAASDVRSGVDRGDGTPGTLVVPGAPYVLNSQTFDGGTAGTLTLPAVSSVLTTAVYGVAGTGSAGTYVEAAAGDVRSGVAFGPSSSYAGTLVVGGGGTYTDPGVANVKTGVSYTYNSVAQTGTYDGSDRWTDPGVANVLTTVNYKANSTTNNRTGTLALPTASQVLASVVFGVGGNGSTGNVVLPAASNVKSGVTFGASSATTGSYDPVTGNYTDPGVGNVVSGISYKFGGSTLVGTYAGGGGGMTLAQLQSELDTRGLTAALTAGTAGLVRANLVQVNGNAATTSDGTAQGGGATSITLTAGDTAGANAYVGRVLTVTAGTGLGQSRVIAAYNSATKAATVHRAWDTVPDATTAYAIDPSAAADVSLWLGSPAGLDRFGRAVNSIVTGAVAAGATTTSVPTTGLAPAVTAADQLKGRILMFPSDTATATLRGQATDITGNAADGTLTVTALSVAPVAGDIFVVQ